MITIEPILYRYTFIEETGEIQKLEIPKYTKRLISKYTNSYSIVYYDPNTHLKKEVKECNIDKYVNHKIYTFVDSSDVVKEIILFELIEKKNRAYSEYKKFSALVNKINTYENEYNSEYKEIRGGKEMAFGEIYDEFCNKFPDAEVKDYRPACSLHIPQLSQPIPYSIIVWLKDGSKIIYIAKED